MDTHVKRLSRFIILAFVLISLFLSIFGCNEPRNTTNPPATAAQPDPLTNTVLEADLIVLGTINDKKYDIVKADSGNVTGTFSYTIFTLTVEKMIKGEDSTYNLFYAPSKDGPYIERGSGVLWIKGSAISAVDLDVVIGRVVKIMVTDNVPVALPTSQWPPLPANQVSPNSELDNLSPVDDLFPS